MDCGISSFYSFSCDVSQGTYVVAGYAVADFVIVGRVTHRVRCRRLCWYVVPVEVNVAS